MNDKVRELYPGCWSIAFNNAKYFFYHRFKVEGDRELIRSLIKDKNWELLQYYENFYNLLRQDQKCNRDISSRTTPVEPWKIYD